MHNKMPIRPSLTIYIKGLLTSSSQLDWVPGAQILVCWVSRCYPSSKDNHLHCKCAQGLLKCWWRLWRSGRLRSCIYFIECQRYKSLLVGREWVQAVLQEMAVGPLRRNSPRGRGSKQDKGHTQKEVLAPRTQWTSLQPVLL